MEVVRSNLAMLQNPEERSHFLSWLFAWRDLGDMWTRHWSYLLGETTFLSLSLLGLLHALRAGGRLKWLWLTAIMHGLATECITYWVEDIDNFWHAQGFLMLVGKRLPLYVLLGLYPFYIYTASTTVSRLRLPWWSEPFAIGLMVVALDIPYDIMGVKLLWWSWHDTDPNIYDRMYWVPWTSYYFHATFAASFTLLFRGSRALLSFRPRWESSNMLVEGLCCLVTALFSFPCGVLQFVLLYHSLQGVYKVPSEVCVLLLLSLYFTLALAGLLSASSERRRVQASQQAREGKQGGRGGGRLMLSVMVLTHYSLYLYLVATEQPEKIVSVGLHETVGPCDQYRPVVQYSLLGQSTSTKRRYFCPQDYDEKYLDFHCVREVPAENSSWYTVCGTGWGNHAEYVSVVAAFCLLCSAIYLIILARPEAHSGDTTHTGLGGGSPGKKVKRQ